MVFLEGENPIITPAHAPHVQLTETLDENISRY